MQILDIESWGAYMSEGLIGVVVDWLVVSLLVFSYFNLICYHHFGLENES